MSCYAVGDVVRLSWGGNDSLFVVYDIGSNFPDKILRVWGRMLFDPTKMRCVCPSCFPDGKKVAHIEGYEP